MNKLLDPRFALVAVVLICWTAVVCFTHADPLPLLAAFGAVLTALGVNHTVTQWQGVDQPAPAAADIAQAAAPLIAEAVKATLPALSSPVVVDAVSVAKAVAPVVEAVAEAQK